METSNQPKRLGPRGGDLDGNQTPQFRQAHFNGETLPDGSLALHRFERHETAVNGKKNEEPWHRMAAYMLNAGRTNIEIALAAEVAESTVSQLRSQVWFQELCVTIANTHGEAILGALESEALASIDVMVKIRDGAESDAVRLNAARTLLEHATGKPIQKVITQNNHTSYASPQEEMDALQQELLHMRQKSMQSPPSLAPS